MFNHNSIVIAGVILTLSAGCISDPSAPEGRKRVFITAASFSGDLGGVAGGDARCASAATAAGLGGTFTAWLSDATTDAIGRMADTGPWFLVDTTSLVFNSKEDLTAQPLVPIIVNESGVAVAFGSGVWTGTVNGGTKSTATCNNWSSTDVPGLIGQVSMNAWTESSSNNCTTFNRLYCFER